MSIRRIRPRLPLIAALLVLCSAGNVQAVSFSIVYDDSVNQSIGNIVGTGTFSYDGPPVVGTFALSSLTGLSFAADFPGIGTFSTSDLDTIFTLSGIAVYDAGGGQFGLVFTGDGGFLGGSLDAVNPGAIGLFHEPTSDVTDPIGSIAGNGSVNLYALIVGGPPLGGDYRGLTTAAGAVPEPASLALLGLGLVAIACRRFRRQRR